VRAQARRADPSGRAPAPAASSDDGGSASGATVLRILEALGCGGLILDGRGRVLAANEKSRRYLGRQFDIRRRDDLAGRDALPFISRTEADRRRLMREFFARVPQTGHDRRHSLQFS
jgi:hypothetical protein